MNIAGGAKQKMEAYLKNLSNGLCGISDVDARDIVEELRSHIVEKASAGGELTSEGVDGALARLGSPAELASQYRTDDLLSRAEISRSPVKVLRNLFRWASLSVAGVVVLVGSLFGYLLGGVLILVVLLEPIHPQAAGLWTSRDGTGDLVVSMSLGFGTAPESARDVLGWWIVPIGLFVGVGLVLLATKFSAWCAGDVEDPG